MFKHIKPPLPFVGNKGSWGSVISDLVAPVPAGVTVFDVFGGSGICSHFVKSARPDLRVVWNDYDDYLARLRNAPNTELLRHRCLDVLGFPLPKGSFLPPLTDSERAVLFNTLDEHLKAYGFIDYQTCSRWFCLYPQKSARFEANSGKFYNRIPRVPLDLERCASWLSDVERTTVTFGGLDTIYSLSAGACSLRSFVEKQNALLILDPPYLATCSDDYSNKESLKILRAVAEAIEHLPFIMFADSSLAFWFEILFRWRKCKTYELQINNSGLNHKTRSETLFCCLPW